MVLAGCAEAQTIEEVPAESSPGTDVTTQTDDKAVKTEDTAIFAGGCFWCVESDFEKLPGVKEAISGYTGGTTKNPTYKEVTYKETGHYEAVKIVYNPQKITYAELLDHFWVNVDPTDPHGQFCDKGSSYRTAIFARDDQLEQANASKAHIINVKPFSEDVVTPVLPASKFYKAEGYHQDYYKKNPVRYRYYRTGCKRDARLEQLWGKTK